LAGHFDFLLRESEVSRSRYPIVITSISIAGHFSGTLQPPI
jgi:hypothetical protein